MFNLTGLDIKMYSKRVFSAAVLMGVMLISGCDQKQEVSCPKMGEAFFKRSIDAYYSEHDKTALGSYELVSGERYDSKNNWWVVPFNRGGKGYLAMISCDGRLELSVGNP